MTILFKILVLFFFTFSNALAVLSPNGQYESSIVTLGKNNLHYIVVNKSSGRTVIQTRARFSTPNDVKAGMFSPDSRYFAAAYHYGHEGKHTWVGVWDTSSGKFVQSRGKPGWLKDLTWVFLPRATNTEKRSPKLKPAISYIRHNCLSPKSYYGGAWGTSLIIENGTFTIKNNSRTRIRVNASTPQLINQGYSYGTMGSVEQSLIINPGDTFSIVLKLPNQCKREWKVTYAEFLD